MLSKEQRKSLEKATLQYMDHLGEAEEYLVGRGISLAQGRSVGLGVVRNPIPGHENLEGRLAIPYLTDFGPVNMTFRCIRNHVCKDSGCHKYELFKGIEANLYSVQSMQNAGDWIGVAEGEIDALSLNVAGIPGVGISGATKWRPFWKNVFEDFSTVYVFQDGDQKGKDFGEKLQIEVGAVRVELPPGEDVNSCLVKHGPAYLRGLIRK
jgi:hypothetical protein